MALQRFTARRGQTFELLSACATNFKGGEKELSNAFETLNPVLKEQLGRKRSNSSLTQQMPPTLEKHGRGRKQHYE